MFVDFSKVYYDSITRAHASQVSGLPEKLTNVTRLSIAETKRKK